MNDDYSIEFHEWLKFEKSRDSDHRSKNFVGDRPYRHLDVRIPRSMLESNEASKLIEELKSPIKLKRHSFFPFLRKDKKVRRFTREYSNDGKKDSVKIDQKLRPIMYASHKDSCIYGFYAYMLKAYYNNKIKGTLIDGSIIAYRRIPRLDGSNRNKSNIDFAKDIHDAIRRTEKCAVLCVDIKGFFNNMRHDNIRRSWVDVLGETDLPTGYEVVYKNITNYRYAFLYEVLEKVKEGRVVKGRFRYSSNAKRKGMIGSPRLYNTLINNTPIVHKNRSIRGIPQGSPISDIIANIYLMDFDYKIANFLESRNEENLYKRYSDDILIICSQNDALETYRYLQTLLIDDSIDLKLSVKKTELFYVDTKVGSLQDNTQLVQSGYSKNKKTIQYLGFEFDLKDINIRSGTIANHYRKTVKSMKIKLRDKIIKPDNHKIHKKNKKTDRYLYFKQALRKIVSPRLNRQFSNIKKRTKTIINGKKRE